MAIHGQLSGIYPVDRYFMDRLQSGIDIPSVQDVLRHLPAKTSKQLNNRAANKLETGSKTTSTVYGNWTEEDGTQGNVAL